MATTFAITGVHRSRLKHYRPSYQSDLPPIYEDAVQRQYIPTRSYSVPENDDYVYVPSYMPSGRYYKQHDSRVNLVHNYEEIDSETLSRGNAVAPPSSLTKAAKSSMLDGIMGNRFQLKTTSLNKCSDADCDNKTVWHTGEHDKNGENKCPLRRKSTVYQGHALENGENISIKTNAETTADLDPNKGSSWQWPKFKPDTFIDPHYWCPAEKKIQKRCFAVCFILLLIIIAIFVIVSLDGWIFKARGTGLSGSDKPIMFVAAAPAFPPDNVTDIRQETSNLTTI